MTRYVYWRQPNTKPYRSLDDKHAMSVVLGEIGTTANTSGGGISWPHLGVSQMETCLRPSVVFLDSKDEELNESDAWSMTWTAVCNTIKKQGGGKPISPKDFIAEANKLASEFFRKPFDKYNLLSALSIKDAPSKRISLAESTLTFPRGRGRFVLPPIANDHFRHTAAFGKTKNKLISIAVSGRTIHEAVSRGLSDLALLRGLWTLHGTFGSWSYSFGSTKSKPLGVIHAGPVHTLHLPDGTSVDDLLWYEPDFEADGKLFSPDNGWSRIEKWRRWAMRKLKELPYGAELKDILARYAVALDQVNLDVAFLHLWSILERLTDTVGARYDDTIQRSVWAYKDRTLAAEFLGAMRLHRNRLVHSGHSAYERDQVAYMVKSFVDPHLFRLLRNDFGVASFEDYGKQLSLPTDVGILKKDKAKLDRAIRFFTKATK